MVHFDNRDFAAWIYLGVFLLSVIISICAIPSVILISKKKKLLDKPDFRKKHGNVTPNLGGIAFFSAFAFSASLFNVGGALNNWSYIFAGVFLLFVTGLKDDLVTIDPYKKFFAQFMAALIVVFLADIRLSSLYGFLGVGSLHFIISFGLSLIGIVFVTNAFNLIDGVDGLAGGIGAIIFTFYGVVFAMNSNYGYAIISFAMVGSLVGFLRYNIHPARIFMGDTGSLVLGFMAAILSIALVENVGVNPANEFINSVFGHGNGLSVTLAAIIVPVYDTFRVFALRISKGISPFHPDRTHIHHILLDCGMTPRQVSATLYAATILFICGSMGMASLGLNNTISIAVIIVAAIGLAYIAVKARNKKKNTNAGKHQLQPETKIGKHSSEEYLNSLLHKCPKEKVYEDGETAVSYIKNAD